MQTTWLSVDPSRSTFVTIQFPQTYSGPSLPGLTWPWAYASTDPSVGTVVSIVGGSEGLLTVDGSDFGESIPQRELLNGRCRASERQNLMSCPMCAIASRMPSDTASVPTGPLSAASPSAVASTSFASSSSFTSSPPSSSSGFSLADSSYSTPSAIAPSSSASRSFTTSSQHGDPSDAFRSTGLGGGAIAGIVLGALVGLLVLLLLLVLCLKRRRRQTSLNPFTFLDPELQPENSSASAPNVRSISARLDRQRQAPTAIIGSSGEYAQRPGPFHEPETEGLMAHHDGVLDPNENAQEYITAPPIVLQSSSSGASVRHCPSNNSISTISAPSANNTDSTRTRASLISQFPTAHDRRTSDHSSRGGHGPGNSTGKPPNSTSGNQGDTREIGDKHSSGGSNIGGDPFTSPPPRPPSRTRSVANTYNGQIVGIGCPLTSLHGLSLSRINPLSQRTGQSGNEAPHAGSSAVLETTGNALERSMSNRSSISMHGAPFSWLKPFFDAGSHPAIMEGCTGEANEDTPQALHNEVTSTQDTAGKKLLPTEVPVMRATPGYRRVTTTAVAYDIQDLRDLSQRPTGQPGVEDDDEGLDSGSDGEQDSLLHSPQAPSPPESVRAPSQGQSRWSRATLGQ